MIPVRRTSAARLKLKSGRGHSTRNCTKRRSPPLRKQRPSKENRLDAFSYGGRRLIGFPPSDVGPTAAAPSGAEIAAYHRMNTHATTERTRPPSSRYRFDSDTPRFAPGVKWKSHRRRYTLYRFYGFNSISLGGYVRPGGFPLSSVEFFCLPTPPLRSCQIRQIGFDPFAVCRFSFDGAFANRGKPAVKLTPEVAS